MTDTENTLVKDAECLLRMTSPGHAYLGSTWTNALTTAGTITDVALVLIQRFITALEDATNERKELQRRIDGYLESEVAEQLNLDKD